MVKTASPGTTQWDEHPETGTVKKTHNACFVGADFVVHIVICGRTNFVVCKLVCIAGKKHYITNCNCLVTFIVQH